MGKSLIEDGKHEEIRKGVPVDRLLVLPEWHSRRDVRAEYPPTPEHVASIMAQGVPDPVFVNVVKKPVEYPATETRDGKAHTLPPGIYLIDGHQRYNAAREAQRQLRANGEKAAEVTLRVLAEQTKDENYLASLSLALNQRIPDSPVVTAEKIAALVRRYGGDVPKAATMAGYSVGFVKQHLALVELAAPVRRAVERGDLAVSAAAKLAKLDAAGQKEALDAALAGADARAPKETTPGNPAKPAKADGRRKAKVTTREVAKAVREKQGKPERPRPMHVAAEAVRDRIVFEPPASATGLAKRPTDGAIRLAIDAANAQGAYGIAKALRWALTGEGDPLAE